MIDMMLSLTSCDKIGLQSLSAIWHLFEIYVIVQSVAGVFCLYCLSCIPIDWFIDWYLISTYQTYMYSSVMTMEVKYKNTKLYKTQTEVTYSERGNGVQMTFYTAPNHT